MIRPARLSDLPAISTLLANAALTTTGVAEHLGTFVVLESGETLVGVGGLEVYESVALIRSLAVESVHRGCGHATAICNHLEAEGTRRGIERFYLLTETAASFFAKRGYASISRNEAPPGIAASREFAEICPQSAVFMQHAP